jgi:hypothetical protein
LWWESTSVLLGFAANVEATSSIGGRLARLIWTKEWEKGSKGKNERNQSTNNRRREMKTEDRGKHKQKPRAGKRPHSFARRYSPEWSFRIPS